MKQNSGYSPRCFPVPTTTDPLASPGPPEIVQFAREQLAFSVDDHQAALLSSGGKRVMLNCPRQWGKSSVAAIKAVHRAWFSPGSLVLAVGPSLRQSGELVLKVGPFLRTLGARVPGNHGTTFKLKNGSRIVDLPASEATTRCYSSVDLLLIDEAARVPDSLYRALRPMLAHGCGGAGGELWLMSTPFGKRRFFWSEWAHGGDGWFRLAVPATDCARFSPSFLEDGAAPPANAGSLRSFSASSTTPMALCSAKNSSAPPFAMTSAIWSYKQDPHPTARRTDRSIPQSSPRPSHRNTS